MVAISPSKAALHPERLPRFQRLVAASIGPTLREEFLARARHTGLNVLDYPSVFRTWQREAEAPLFPRGGVHWSNHAAARAASFLLDFVEQVGRVDLRNIDVTGSRWSPVPIGADGDLARLANTLDASRFDDPTLIPELGLRDGDAGRPAALLMIGTSFCWQLGSTWSRLGATRSVELWYYAKSAWRFEDGERVAADASAPQDLAALRLALLAVDAVVIECNESSLPRIGAGSIAPALLAFGIEPGRPLTSAEIQAHSSR